MFFRDRRDAGQKLASRLADSAPHQTHAGKIVILVDDGLATGSTMRAAVEALKQQQPARVVVAVPVASPETCQDLRREADEVVCLVTPEPFYSVGLWYQDFSQTTDEEVRALLETATRPEPAHAAA